jgi:hypothetical protein
MNLTDIKIMNMEMEKTGENYNILCMEERQEDQ